VGAKKRARTAWTYEMSIFKPYLAEENPDLVTKCFEQDWATMKKIKFKKSSEEDIKEEMRKVYLLLKENYRV